MYCGGVFCYLSFFVFFFFNDTATTEIYTLSLHDALPISEEEAEEELDEIKKQLSDLQDKLSKMSK